MAEGIAIPTTITRSVLTVLVPGLVAVAPWLLALVQHTQATFGFDKYPTLAHLMLFASIVVTGSIFEGIGSLFESRWDGKLAGEMDVEGDWFAYLANKQSPVGHRYLSRLVTTLYFELAMVFAAPTFVAGAMTLTTLRFPSLPWWIHLLFVVTGLAVAAYFYWQASKTHRALCVTRRELRSRAS
ncbi:hypothetical protein DVT68_20045 [Dyella solisilvae]|uniref:Uncharacterized protein n=1 Tax=Dyella solisilvae TaxID=1920168 RepID=A0A370K2I3_9GAMM|nr:hypothetical protein [Dyella solisilvae]RDI96798.1 hypothetical protein DVT68_20045 [Dyella solisilvae]